MIMLCCYVYVIIKWYFFEGNVYVFLLDFMLYFWVYLLYFERGYNVFFIVSICGYFVINNINFIVIYICRFLLNWFN